MQPKPLSSRWPLVRLLGGIVLIGGLLLYFIGALTQAQHEDQFSNASLHELKEAHAGHPEDDSVTYELAHALERDNENEQALQLMQKLVQKQPQNLTYWKGLARCAGDSGRASVALDAYKKCEDLSPGWADAHFERAEILAAAGLLTEALPEYDQGAKLDPTGKTNIDPWIQCLMVAGRNQEAWDRLMTTTRKTRLSDLSYEYLTELGIRLKRIDEVNTLLEGRIGSTPLYPTGKFRIDQLRLILAEQPEQPDAQALRAEQPDVQALRDAEVVALSVAQGGDLRTKGIEQRAEFYAMLGHIRILRANLSGAESAFVAGLKLDPDNVECLEDLADVSQRMGKAAQEQQVWKHLRKLTGETPEVVALRKIVRATPQYTAARLNLAIALEKAGIYGEAAEQYDQVLQRNPQEPTALAHRDPVRQKALDKFEHLSQKLSAEAKAQ